MAVSDQGASAGAATPTEGVSGETSRYARMGADGNNEGLYVRFEPGFGLNVYIGWRTGIYVQGQPFGFGRKPHHYEDRNEIAMSIKGWEQIGEFVDEWRAREAR